MSNRKAISFSVDLNFDIGEKIYNHVLSKGRGNQSEYLRLLVYNDMMNIRNFVTATTQYEEPTIENDTESLEGFL